MKFENPKQIKFELCERFEARNNLLSLPNFFCELHELLRVFRDKVGKLEIKTKKRANNFHEQETENFKNFSKLFGFVRDELCCE